MHTSDTSPQSRVASGRATNDRRYAEDIALADLLLPDHLRLGAHNWLEFKLAIETMIELRGISITHLRCAKCPPPFPLVYTTAGHTDRAEAEALTRGKWSTDDDLCKTIIVLNVRSEHTRLVEYNHILCSAAELWEILARRDEEIRKEWERKVAWLDCVRALAPWVFLVIACAAWLMGA